MVDAAAVAAGRLRASDWGETHTLREFCECAFRRLGLDCRRYVREDSSTYRPLESIPLVGNAAKAKQVLGLEPQIRFGELVDMMVSANLQMLGGNN